MSEALARTSLQLYRDCLRLAAHVGGKSAKSEAIAKTIRKEFEKHRFEKDGEKIQTLKANAIRGLSNYLVFASAKKDKSIQESMKKSMKQTNKEYQEYKAQMSEATFKDV